MTDKLILIDGHSLIFRMYYAFLKRPMVNSKGQDTSILFGFTKYLLELINKQKPTHIAVAFDPPGGTFRNQMYPEYKANRGETPQLVIDALQPLTEIVEAMKIPVLMMSGFEADDVIGSVAKQFASDSLDVYMVTPDKDYGQLIAPHIFQLKPGKAGGEDELVGLAQILEKYGIQSPEQVIEVLTICGDAADNVPGVKGVGEVGATKLLAQYGSVEAIYAHLGELSDSLRRKFEDSRAHISLSHELVTIKTDIELPLTLGQMRYNADFSPRILTLFDEFEFPSLKRYIAHVKAAPKAAPQSGTVSTWGCEEFSLEESGEFLGNQELIKCTYGAKDLYKAAWSAGMEIKGTVEDVELMHYLIDPERSHKLEDLASSYLGLDISAGKEEKGEPELFSEPLSELPSEDYGLKASAVARLAEKLRLQMQENNCEDLYELIEEPLIPVLARMEKTGVKVDLASLRDFANSLRERIARKEAQVRELAGEPELNVGSPKQVGELLFDKMKLDPNAKKSGKQWSTDEETLLALADRSPIIDAILDYRGARKLLNTYIEPFPSYISPLDGRIHTTFNQALTATGRLSSSNPNLQNIPIRTEEGKEIRKAFVPQDPSWFILSADYSQIELRIMAHLCKDEHLIKAFKDGEDVHAATAAKIFGIDISEVSPEQRRIAKTANFGIMYGISAFGLSQRLRCSRGEAKKIIDDYFASFPSIRDFIDSTLAQTRERGYVETIFGRRRYIRDINASNANLRSLAERNAVNAPIQGSSADIIKKAMIAVDGRMQSERLKSKMVLQIHDELLFEVPPEELELMRRLVTEEMESVLELSVPLTVECSYGKNWLEAH